MMEYDFKNLSFVDFEKLVRDLFQAQWRIKIESFKSGKDKGIDLRYSPVGHKVIFQCKHYATSGFSQLFSNLKKEVSKVQKLNPDRYIVVTSVPLSVTEKDKIKSLFEPYCQTTADICGKEDLNNLLAKHKTIEQQHIKLWMGSIAVLQRVLNSKIHNYSETQVRYIRDKIKVYVHNNSYAAAREILKENNFVVLSGIPGIGKTTLAEILIYRYLERGWSFINILDIEEAFTLYNRAEKQLFFFDDFLGQTFLHDRLKKQDDQRIKNFIEMVQRSPRTRFILTTREHILKQAQSAYEKLFFSPIDKGKCVIDLGNYRAIDRAEILYNHLAFSKLPVEFLNALVDSKVYEKIIEHPNYSPRLINRLSNHDNFKDVTADAYPKFFLETLKRPLDLWQHAFDTQITEDSRILLYCLLSLEDSCALDRLMAFFCKYLDRTEKDFKKSMKELEGTFTLTNKDYSDELKVTYHNPSVRDFLQAHLLEDSTYLKVMLDASESCKQILKLWGSESYLTDDNLSRQALTKNKEALFSCIKKHWEDETIGLSATAFACLLGSITLSCADAKFRKLFLQSLERINSEDLEDLKQIEDLSVSYIGSLKSTLTSSEQKVAIGIVKNIVKEFLEAESLQNLESCNFLVEYAPIYLELSDEEAEFYRSYAEGFLESELLYDECSQLSDSQSMYEYIDKVKFIMRNTSYIYGVVEPLVERAQQTESSESAGDYGDDDWSERLGNDSDKYDKAEIANMFDSLKE